MSPLPLDPALLALLAVMLGTSMWRDTLYHRIDNWITFPGALAGIGMQASLSGLSGMADALAGLSVGFIVLLPFYVRGGMAAGDVKLMAAAGTCLGPLLAFWAAAYALVAGSILALFILATRGSLGRGLAHMGRQAWGYALTRVWVPAGGRSILARRFPYAMAIAGGCLLLVMVGMPKGL